MIKRLVLIPLLVLAIGPGCASTPSEPEDGGVEEAGTDAEGEGGLSDEPLGEGETGGDETQIVDGAETGEDGEGPGGGGSAMPSERSLFDRVGGKSKFQLFASNLVDALASNGDLSKNTKVANALKGSQKEMVADFFCMKAGGPCNFSGKDLGEAFGGVMLNKDEYKVFRKVFVQTLRKMKIPRQERTELATIAGRQKRTFVQ